TTASSCSRRSCGPGPDARSSSSSTTGGGRPSVSGCRPATSAAGSGYPPLDLERPHGEQGVASVRALPAPAAGGRRAALIRLPSHAQQRLDRPPLVHRAVRLGSVLERHLEVEDLPGIDLPLPDE